MKFCPQCGARVLPDAAYCISCGGKLPQIPLEAHATGMREGIHAAGADAVAERTGARHRWFERFIFWRQKCDSVEDLLAHKRPTPRVRASFFNVLAALVIFGLSGAIALPLLAGQHVSGRDVGGFAIWTVILSYVFLRRRDTSKSRSLLYAIAFGVAMLGVVGVLDGIVNRDRFALEREFAKNSALVALKESQLKAYSAFFETILKHVRAGGNSVTTSQVMARELHNLLAQTITRAPDGSLITFYRAKARYLEKLRVTKPEVCYHVGMGSYSSANHGTSLDSTPQEVTDALAILIRASVNQPVRSVDAPKADMSFAKANESASAALGVNARFLELVDDPKGDFHGACAGVVALMRAIIALPPDEAGNAIRSLATMPRRRRLSRFNKSRTHTRHVQLNAAHSLSTHPMTHTRARNVN